MGLNNPIPRNLKNESKKAARVLTTFIKPSQMIGPDQVIPTSLLKRAKGLAIITVLKAGFLFSGRAGSGVIVARLRDGTWSPPSAIGMAGAGAGGMIGAELTDFVFILNTDDAVRSFSEFGTITLGGNISVSAGPLGRTAEAAASASAGGVSAVYSYSRSHGLYLGVSIEGSVIVERREANRKLYGDNCTTKLILSGRVRAPPAAEPLLRVLESRAFNYNNSGYGPADDYDSDGYYNDTSGSVYDETGSSSRFSRSNNSNRNDYHNYSDECDDNYEDRSSTRAYYSNYRTPDKVSRPQRNHDSYDDSYSGSNRHIPDIDDLSNKFSRTRVSTPLSRAHTSGLESALTSPSLNAPKAVALFSFAGETDGDLSFRKGDVIIIMKKSGTQDDWWTGRVKGKEGLFPANYVEIV